MEPNDSQGPDVYRLANEGQTFRDVYRKTAAAIKDRMLTAGVLKSELQSIADTVSADLKTA